MLHADYSGALEDKHVKVTFIHYGARKIDGNPYQQLSEPALEGFQAEVNRIGEMFVATVARNRGVDSKAVKGTEAGIFFGENGLGVGFADQVGTVSDALAALRARIQSNAGSAARAAASTRKGRRMENEETTAAAPESAAAATQAAALVTARTEGFAQAARIVGLAALAGFSARQAQGFLRQDATIEVLQQEMVDAQAANAGDEIHSHILPDAGTGASAGKTEDSAIVKACAARAGKEKR